MALISRDAHVKSIPSVYIVFVNGFADPCALAEGQGANANFFERPPPESQPQGEHTFP
jgi:hypothetical protein